MPGSLPAAVVELAEQVRATAASFAGDVRRTPIIEFSLGDIDVSLKLENLQHTGSFKYRGALATLRQAQTLGAITACVTYSAGNHGRAVARAARAARVPATVFMPDFADSEKVALVEREGATTRLVPGDSLSTTVTAHAEETGDLFIHPFDQTSVMAGQGTVGLEFFEDQPALDALLVPVGGGGLVSGIAAIASQFHPDTRIIAVEPERAADLNESLSVGKVVVWDREVTATTIADGLRAPFVGEAPWQIIHTQLTEALTVSDETIRAAMRLIVQHTNTIVEPSGAVATAALLQHPELFSGLRVGAVVSGGNLSLDQFTKLLAGN